MYEKLNHQSLSDNHQSLNYWWVAGISIFNMHPVFALCHDDVPHSSDEWKVDMPWVRLESMTEEMMKLKVGIEQNEHKALYEVIFHVLGYLLVLVVLILNKNY